MFLDSRKFFHESQWGLKPRIIVLARASRNLLLCCVMQNCKIWVMRVPRGPKLRTAVLARANNNFPGIDRQLDRAVE
jgi:hypothetical protein